MSATDAAVQEVGQRPTTERIVNDFAIQVATVNGSGSQTANLVLLRSIFQMGVPVSGKNMFPSNIAGLPTWYTIRASAKGYIGRKKEVDFLVAMNPETAREDVLTLAAWSRGCLRRAAQAQRTASGPHLLPGPLRQADAADYARCEAAPARAQHDLRRRAVAAAVDRHGADGEGPQEADGEEAEGDRAEHVRRSRPGSDYAEATFTKQDPFVIEPMNKTQGMILIEGNAAAAIGCMMAGVTFVALVSDHAVLVALRIADRLPQEIPSRSGNAARRPTRSSRPRTNLPRSEW